MSVCVYRSVYVCVHVYVGECVHMCEGWPHHSPINGQQFSLKEEALKFKVRVRVVLRKDS